MLIYLCIYIFTQKGFEVDYKFTYNKIEKNKIIENQRQGKIQTVRKGKFGGNKNEVM